MKKNTCNNGFYGKDTCSPGQHIDEFDIFKSRVANAMLDYMDSQCDPQLFESLEKVSRFFNDITTEMEKVFSVDNQELTNSENLFEIGEDLFASIKTISSDLVH